MKDWNPITYPFCKECPFYKSKGHLLFNKTPTLKETQCQHMENCKRFYGAMESLIQKSREIEQKNEEYD